MISIQRAMHKVHNTNNVGEPKSEKARRLVAVPSFVLRVLKEKRANSPMLVTRSGTTFSHRNIHRHFKGILVKSGLSDIRFHDLRHTFASIMLAQNVHVKTVQDALVHSSVLPTLDLYSHLMPGMQEKAAGKMDQALGAA